MREGLEIIGPDTNSFVSADFAVLKLGCAQHFRKRSFGRMTLGQHAPLSTAHEPDNRHVG